MSHHPPHLYLDDTWYSITGAIYLRRRLLRTDEHKILVRNQLKTLVIEFELRLTAWVIQDNHYHILIKSNRGQDLSRFIGRWHGRTSYEINGLDGTRGRQVWHNSWDTCIRGEADYWKRFNYIHHNPVKHGYVAKMEDWPFSSYRFYLNRNGIQWLDHAFELYPIIDYTDPKDDF